MSENELILDSENSAIGKRLKEFREKRGLSQNNLACMLGVTGSLISKMESGNKTVSENVLKELEELYYIDPDWLINGIFSETKSAEEINLEKEIFDIARDAQKFMMDSLSVWVQRRLIINENELRDAISFEKIMSAYEYGLDFNEKKIHFDKWVSELKNEPVKYIERLLKDYETKITTIRKYISFFKHNNQHLLKEAEALKNLVAHNRRELKSYLDLYKKEGCTMVDVWIDALSVRKKHLAKYLLEEYERKFE